MELNEKWKEQAEIENDKIEYDEHTTLADEFKNGFIKGAETYADAVEKMLKDALSTWEEHQVIFGERPNIISKIRELKELLKELKSIQP